MPGRQGSSEVDERITVAVWAGMSTGGELVYASLAGGQKPSCRTQPGGDHLSRRAQPHFLGEGRQFPEADKHWLAQLQFGYQR
jgi:hypothetical protein